MTDVLLARHGETDDNAAGRVQGSLDPPLNARGREQASALARRAGSVGLRALYTSHLRRAAETARIVAEAIGVEPVVDERLAESRRGSWEGRLLRDIERDEPDAYRAWREARSGFRFPGGGESLAEHVARVDAALTDIVAGPLPALVVCHGGTIRCALAGGDPARLHEAMRVPVPNGELIPLPVRTRPTIF